MYRNDQLSTEFRTVIKGNNFMTPHVVGFWSVNDYVVELSKGNGFNGERIYGVTVVNRETQERELDLDQSFNSLAQAKDKKKLSEVTEKAKNSKKSNRSGMKYELVKQERLER